MTQLPLLSSPSAWQPYYLAYARARGMAPEAVFARDHRLPGPARYFMAWIQRRWREWDAETQRRGGEFHAPAEREAFEKWLEAWAEKRFQTAHGAKG